MIVRMKDLEINISLNEASTPVVELPMLHQQLEVGGQSIHDVVEMTILFVVTLRLITLFERRVNNHRKSRQLCPIVLAKIGGGGCGFPKMMNQHP